MSSRAVQKSRRSQKNRSKKDAQMLAKTRLMTDFITSQPRSPQSGTDAVSDASSKSSTECEGLCSSGVAGEVADSATATAAQDNERADNPHIDDINAEVDDSLAGELDEDDKPTDVQAAIIEPHPDGDDDEIGLWRDHLSQELVEYWAKKGAIDLQHCDKLLKLKSSQQKVGDSTRRCTPSMFE